MTNCHNLNPTFWPTEKEFSDAKEKFGYVPGNLHFAVVGGTCVGKSTLVNSFRGLTANSDNAAPTGYNRITIEAGRYPHPDKKSPLSRIVWYDMPGSGTRTTPGGYFNAQGLFIFDFIIVVLGERFMTNDIDVLARCKAYNIPYFVVRPMADCRIWNTQSDINCSYDEAYKICIDGSRSAFKKFLKEASENVCLDCDKEMFLVSKNPLRELIKSLMDGKAPESTEGLIDEQSLVTNILLVAQKGCCPSEYGVGWALMEPPNPVYRSLYRFAGEFEHQTQNTKRKWASPPQPTKDNMKRHRYHDATTPFTNQIWR